MTRKQMDRALSGAAPFASPSAGIVGQQHIHGVRARTLTARASADLAYRNDVAIVTMAKGGLMY
jgi:hypothetical protein